jgi:hypothetical protein
VAEKALSETYETINAFAALFHDVFLQIKGISYYLVILAMFLCHYATIYADWTDPTQRKSKHSRASIVPSTHWPRFAARLTKSRHTHASSRFARESPRRRVASKPREDRAKLSRNNPVYISQLYAQGRSSHVHSMQVFDVRASTY